jgi:hypothetical protein
LAVLAWRHDPITGLLTMDAAWPKAHPKISELKPVARVVSEVDGVRLTGEPVYFDVAPPTPYESVTVEAIVHPNDAAMVELGALATADGRYDIGAAYARAIETLDWPTVASGDLALKQRRQDFLSLDDFLDATTAAAMVYPAGVAATTPPAMASSGMRAYAVSARGAHRLFARVPAGERLRLTLTVQDINRQPGADAVKLTVFRAGSDIQLENMTLPDDGNATEDGRATEPRVMNLDWPADEAGEYWMTFDAPDDVFIRQLATPLAEVGFLGRVYFGDEVGYADVSEPVTCLVSGRRLQARPMRAEALQTISVDGSGMALAAVGAAVDRRLDGSAFVSVPRRGLVLTTDGRITLGGSPIEAALTLDRQDDETSLSEDGIDYLLYRTGDLQRLDDGSYRLTATFRAADLALTSAGAYRFVLNVVMPEEAAPASARTPAPTPALAAPATLDHVRLTWRRSALPPIEWLQRLVRRDVPLTSGEETPRPDLVDFDEQIP